MMIVIKGRDRRDIRGDSTPRNQPQNVDRSQSSVVAQSYGSIHPELVNAYEINSDDELVDTDYLTIKGSRNILTMSQAHRQTCVVNIEHDNTHSNSVADGPVTHNFAA